MNKREIKFFTVKQLHKRLGVSEKSIRRWIWIGELKHHRLGTLIKVSEEDLEAFLAIRRK